MFRRLRHRIDANRAVIARAAQFFALACSSAASSNVAAGPARYGISDWIYVEISDAERVGLGPIAPAVTAVSRNPNR